MLSSYHPKDIIKLLGLALLYALLAWLVLPRFSDNGVVSSIWPSSGLALAALLAGGGKYAPGVYLGAWLANVAAGVTLVPALFIAAGNTLEAMAGVWLLRRGGGFNPDLNTLHDFLRLLVLGGFVAPALGGTLGTTALWLSDFPGIGGYSANLLRWYMGDAMGVVLLTPLLLVWRRPPPDWRLPRRGAEAALMLGLSLLAGQAIFLGWFHDTVGFLAKGYWMFLFTTWTAARLGTHGVLAVLAATAVQAICGIHLGVGFFAGEEAAITLNYWPYLMILAITGMALATYTGELKRVADEQRLAAMVFEHSNEGIVVTDRQNRILSANPMFQTITGYGAAEVLGRMPGEFLHSGRQDDAFYRTMWQAIQQHGRWQGELWNRRKNGEIYPEWLSIATLKGADGGITHHLAIVADISGKKRAEELLQAKQTELEHAQAIAHVGSWSLDVYADRLAWSAETRRIFEVGDDRTLDYRGFLACVHPDDRRTVDAAWQAALAGAPYDVEHRIVTTSGIKWVRERAELAFGPDGMLRACIGTVQDISERVQAEQALAESERFLRAALDALSSHIAVLDGDGIILSTNRAWRKFAQRNGLAEQAGEGKNYLAVCDAAAAAGDADAASAAALIRQVIAGQRDETEFTYACHSPQEQRWFHCRITRFPGTGPVRLTLAHENVTARKRAEETLLALNDELENKVRQRTAELRESQDRLQAIIENLPEAFFIKDLEGRYLMVNRCCEEAVGMARTAMVGRSDYDIFPKDLAQAFTRRDREAIRKKKPLSSEDSKAHADGSVHDYLTTLFPLVDPQGQVYAVAGVSADVTRSKQLQREIVGAKEEAERLARLKSEFLANMSHEIRTPLNAVLGLARIGERDSQGRAAQCTFRRILDAGGHLLGVVNDILDFSKIEAGKLAIEPHDFLLAGAVDEAVGFVAERAREKGLALQVAPAAGLAAAVHGDSLRLGQILLNLLSNAVKFTERGAVSLEVGRDAGIAWFRVADTGIGMSLEQLSHLFTPFEQADGATTRKYGGSGLGLAISQQLAHLMGGAIAVESRPGEGSVFTLRLPLPDAAAPPMPTATAPPSQPAGGRLAGLRVLAADDVEVNRYILGELLADEGADAVFADNGLQALHVLETSGADAFDVVLMDVQMPVMDGREAVRRIRGIAPGLPVIALTAHALAEERDLCLAAGMADHVAKPINLDELVAAIRRAIGQTDGARQTAAGGQTPPPADTATAGGAIDWPALSARFKGRQDFIAKLASMVCANHADTPDKLRGAADGKDLPTLAFHAHSLKGLGGNLQAHGLLEQAKRTETAARAGDGAATALGRELADAMDELLAELARVS